MTHGRSSNFGTSPWLIYVVSALVCLVWNYHAGKDLNWDLLNYHYYLPHSLVTGRLGQDIFPASLQSYLNPVGYLPFYWMVQAGWHSLLVASVLACLHALNLLLLERICRHYIGRDGNAAVWVAVLLGVLTPMFWVEVGTSFNDVTVSIAILAAVLLATIHAPAHGGRALVALGLAGVCMGVATGLKLTAGTFAVAGAAFCLVRDVRSFSKRLGCYVLGGVLGALVSAGWWAVLVAREFGNPIFPLYNALFRSPWYEPINITLTRFIPGSFADAIRLFVEMAEPVSWVYTETIAPDLRVIFVLVVAVLVAGHFLLQRTRARVRNVTATQEQTMPDVRTFWLFLLLSFLLWLVTSANGRYGVAWLLLLGPLAYTLLRQVGSSRATVACMAVVALLQGVHAGLNMQERWNAHEWTPTWFGLDVPARAREESRLYLSVGMQTHAFLAPFVHPRSSFINVIGQLSLDPDGSAGQRLREQLRLHDGRARLLLGAPRDLEQYKGRDQFIGRYNEPLARFGFSVDQSDCEYMKMSPGADSTGKDEEQVFLSCALRPTRVDPRAKAARLAAGRIFDAIQASCPLLLAPGNKGVDRVRGAYMRSFIGTEFDLVLADDGKVYASQVRTPVHFSFGTRADWERGPIPDYSCPARQRAAPWFDGSPRTAVK